MDKYKEGEDKLKPVLYILPPDFPRKAALREQRNGSLVEEAVLTKTREG